jgi:hypothetical protein
MYIAGYCNILCKYAQFCHDAARRMGLEIIAEFIINDGLSFYINL